MSKSPTEKKETAHREFPRNKIFETFFFSLYNTNKVRTATMAVILCERGREKIVYVVGEKCTHLLWVNKFYQMSFTLK